MAALSSVAHSTPSRAEVDTWAKDLESADPDSVIRFAVDIFGSRLAVATQFGAEGCTLLHRVSRIAPESYIFTVDTGLLFEETYRLADDLEAKLGITIARVKPDYTVGEQAVKHGPNLWEKDPDLCCTIRKVLPMQKALSGYGAWMTSVRREQNSNRATMPVVQWDERFGLVKFAPLLSQTAADIQSYVKAHEIPVNPLRIIGYQSIGCMPCTRPVAEGEDPRAGRWWRSSKTECGLHGR